jgi:hypothetical protein
MKKYQLNVLLIALTSLFMFFILPLRLLIIYPGSELLVALLYSLIFLGIYAALYPTLLAFSQQEFFRAASTLVAAVLSAALLTGVFAQQVGTTINHTYQAPADYLVVGDYLRDQQGINIYAIDLTGWIVLKFGLVFIVFFGILTRVWSRLLALLFKHN